MSSCRCMMTKEEPFAEVPQMTCWQGIAFGLWSITKHGSTNDRVMGSGRHPYLDCCSRCSRGRCGREPQIHSSTRRRVVNDHSASPIGSRKAVCHDKMCTDQTVCGELRRSYVPRISGRSVGMDGRVWRTKTRLTNNPYRGK